MNNSIDVSFYLQDLVWTILIKIQYKTSNSKRTNGWKYTPPPTRAKEG